MVWLILFIMLILMDSMFCFMFLVLLMGFSAFREGVVCFRDLHYGIILHEIRCYPANHFLYILTPQDGFERYIPTGVDVAVKRIINVLEEAPEAKRALRELKFLHLLSGHKNILSIKDVLLPGERD